MSENLSVERPPPEEDDVPQEGEELDWLRFKIRHFSTPLAPKSHRFDTLILRRKRGFTVYEAASRCDEKFEPHLEYLATLSSDCFTNTIRARAEAMFNRRSTVTNNFEYSKEALDNILAGLTSNGKPSKNSAGRKVARSMLAWVAMDNRAQHYIENKVEREDAGPIESLSVALEVDPQTHEIQRFAAVTGRRWLKSPSNMSRFAIEGEYDILSMTALTKSQLAEFPVKRLQKILCPSSCRIDALGTSAHRVVVRDVNKNDNANSKTPLPPGNVEQKICLGTIEFLMNWGRQYVTDGKWKVKGFTEKYLAHTDRFWENRSLDDHSMAKVHFDPVRVNI